MDAGWQATGCKGGLYHSAKVPPCKTRAFIWAVEEVWKCFELHTHTLSLAHLHSQTITNHWQLQIDIIHHQQQQSLYYKPLTNANKVTTRWEGPQSLSYHKQSLGNEKRWASVCTMMFNQFLTSNQSNVHKKFMLLNEFIVLIRRGDDISSCFHLKDDL